MHEHDIDLIQALADGELTGATATAAEAEIAACPQCSADLALQHRAIDALANAPRMYLSAGESSRLRAAVRRELKLESDVVQLKRRERRRLPLSALAGAAAVLIAVVAIAPQLDLLGSGDDDLVLTLEEMGEALDAPAPASADTEPPVAFAPPAPPQPEEDTQAAEALPRNDGEFSAEQPPAAMAGDAPESVDLEILRNLYIEFEGAIPDESLAAARVFVPEAAEPAVPPADQGTRLEDADLTCDLSAVPGVPEGATPSVLGLTLSQDSPAFIIAFEGETAGDVLLTVLNADTCEVVDQR